MSWKVQALVSERICGGMSRKMILINMAARANDDGTGVFAALPTMAAWCEVDARTIRRVVRSIEQDGLVRIVGQRECKNGYVHEWALDLEAIAALPLVKDEIEERRKINNDRKRTADIMSPRTLSPPGHNTPPDIKSGRTQSPVTPDIMSAKSILEPIPSSSKKERVRKPKASKHPIPIDWAPSQALIDFASEHGYSVHEARFIGHKVVTHFTATGEHRPGWDNTYRNWVTRENPRQVKAAAAQWRAPMFDRTAALRIFREHGYRHPLLTDADIGEAA